MPLEDISYSSSIVGPCCAPLSKPHLQSFPPGQQCGYQCSCSSLSLEEKPYWTHSVPRLSSPSQTQEEPKSLSLNPPSLVLTTCLPPLRSRSLNTIPPHYPTPRVPGLQCLPCCQCLLQDPAPGLHFFKMTFPKTHSNQMLSGTYVDVTGLEAFRTCRRGKPTSQGQQLQARLQTLVEGPSLLPTCCRAQVWLRLCYIISGTSLTHMLKLSATTSLTHGSFL